MVGGRNERTQKNTRVGNMSVIYTPKGKAREYSPLALNIYLGCSHQCKYCYCRSYFSFFSDVVKSRKDIISQLEKELSQRKIEKQVLLSFIGDVYCEGANITRDVLQILLKYQIPVAILTKNKNVLRDINLFKKFKKIMVGFTLTFTEEKHSLFYEPNASLPQERFEALKILHSNNIKTFVSLEPVIKPDQSLKIIDITHKDVDLFKVGKLNHHSEIERTINWSDFVVKAVKKLREYKKDFYIKKDLRKFIPQNFEIESKYLNPENWFIK